MAATDFVTESQVDSLTTAIATAVKANATAIGTKAAASALTAHISNATGAHAASAISIADAGNKITATEVEGALQEIKTLVDALGSPLVIDDATTSTTKVWSSSKTNTAIGAAVSALVASSPAALDTLNELAAALGNDANFATTTATALGKRVRVDAAQSFTAPEKAQGLANLGIVASTVNFASNFNTLIA
jgi:hypothetical protein